MGLVHALFLCALTSTLAGVSSPAWAQEAAEASAEEGAAEEAADDVGDADDTGEETANEGEDAEQETAEAAGDPEQGTPEEPAAATQGNASATTAFLWQGFKHDWLRQVLGSWSVPHRVSLLENRIGDETHTSTENALESTGAFYFAQSTGVDGDYMFPEGYWSRVHSPDLHVQRGVAELDFADQTQGERVPKAFRRFNHLIVVDAPIEGASHSVALFQGFSVRSRCLDAAEDCNSDCLWPYRFLVELGTCQPVGDETVCPLNVEIGRAWTPNRGGVKVIEEKRVSDRMSLDIDVHYVVLTGPADTFFSKRTLFENALASNHRMIFDEQLIPLPAGESGMTEPKATVGISSFGFQFYPTGYRRDLLHRGRYVGGWALRLRMDDLDAERGVATIGHSGGIFLPRTVTSTGVSVELGMTVFQFGHADAQVSEGALVTGLICSDSHGAPFFSRWKQCDKVANGQEQIETKVGFEYRTSSVKVGL
jgi:hypothetical protein